MVSSDSIKKIESDINDLNVVKRYEDKEGNYLSGKINEGIIKEDLSEMLYRRWFITNAINQSNWYFLNSSILKNLECFLLYCYIGDFYFCTAISIIVIVYLSTLITIMITYNLLIAFVF